MHICKSMICVFFRRCSRTRLFPEAFVSGNQFRRCSRKRLFPETDVSGIVFLRKLGSDMSKLSLRKPQHLIYLNSIAMQTCVGFAT